MWTSLHPDLGLVGKRVSPVMNRFFSKLNLSDIRIEKEGKSFPPDADDFDEPVESVATSEAQPETVAVVADEVEAETFEPAEPAIESNGHAPNGDYRSYEEATAAYASVAEVAPQNGHAEPIFADCDVVALVGEVLKVSARSRPSAVAGAIAGVVRECGKAEVQAIGAGATNQAIKAVAIARDYLMETGIDAVCVPAFIDVTIENEDRTAIRLVVEPRA